MPDGDILRASIEGTFDGEPTVVDLGFVSQSGSADFAAEAAMLYNDLNAAFDFNNNAGPYLSPLSAQYKLTGIRIQDLAPGLAAGLVFPASGIGSNATDDGLPPQCALAITWRTGLKGKQNRGRSYLTGFAEDSQTGGFWIPEIQAYAQDVWVTTMLTAFGPLGTPNHVFSVVHTVSGGVRLTPPTATPIIAATVRNEVRTLRRRGVGVRVSRHRSAP